MLQYLSNREEEKQAQAAPTHTESFLAFSHAAISP